MTETAAIPAILPGSIAYSAVPCPFGDLWIAAGPDGLVAVAFGMDELRFYHDIVPLGVPGRDEAAMDGVARQFEEYFAGRRNEFDLPLDLSSLSPFQRHVLRAVYDVPYGTVASYKDIARAVGKPLAARAVGSAVAANPLTIIVPCHRIIRSDGTPGEYGLRSWGARGVEYKLRLLALEGYRF